MYLKTLTIHGFKSFANRTVLEFPSSLIGIVGPNGSGKSNICDAIRWVLGEQSSKNLRGDKMEDVIFSGTASVPQAQQSEVKLIFDNRAKYFKKLDSDDFVLTRRLNRNGNSDYVINGESSRLKDIKEIIMDTGLGRDAYSIIGQGMVETIISSRGSERRTIIEEAAGIVKYKANKNEALKKVLDTQVNIDSLTVLITELEKNLAPLSMSAQIAKKFLVLDEQLKTAQKKKLVFEFDRFHRDIANSRSTMDVYQKKREEHNSKITIFNAEIEAAQARIVTLNDKMALIKKNNADVLIEHEALTEVEKQLVAKVTEINTNRENSVRNADETRQKIDDLDISIKNLQLDITEANENLDELKKKDAKLSEDLLTVNAKLSSSENQVSTSQDSTLDMVNQRNNAKNSLMGHEKDLKYAQEQIRKLKFDIEKLNAKKKDAEEKSRRSSGDQGATREKFEKLAKKLAELAEKIAALAEDEKALRQTVTRDTEEFLNLRASFAAQEQMKKNHDQFKHGVRFILQEKQKNPQRFQGLFGVVSELVRTAPEYETALEVALGNHMQSIVVEHSKDTEYCIELLKRSNAGRVTFLPLNTIRPQPPVSAPKNLYGFIGLFSEIVKFDPKFKSIFEYLLGGVMLVDSLQHVNEFTAFNRFQGRIVTLDGELITSAGTITGGSLDNRARTGSQFGGGTENLDQMRSRIVYLDDRIKTGNQKLDDISGRLSSLRNEEDAAKFEHARLKAAIEHFEESSGDHFKEYFENVRAELAAMEEQLAANEIRVPELETLIESDRRLVADLDAKYNDYTESVKKSKDKFSIEKLRQTELMNLITNNKVEAGACTEKIKGLQQNLISQQEEMQKLTKRLAQGESDLEKLEALFRDEDAKLKDAQTKLNAIKAQADTIISEGNAINEELKTLEGTIRVKENLVKTRTNQAAELLTKIHEIDVSLAQIETNARNVLNTLESDFKIREDEFGPFRSAEFNYERNNEEIANLQQSIAMLGIVNLSAIKDHEDLVARVNELKSQRDDLLQARDNMYKIVEEIDAKCTKMFNETFNRINEHIGEIFQILFEGGSARLVLENPEKPLESPIDIKAQPPGKKLQSISLMSGGEKSMTALSLLFSILRVKPSPFCILDEVEAALDEHNVLRFIKMLNNFREKTQFLVITHNKQTMQHLDLLFGVTMEERGISKIISVRLEEAYDIVDTMIEKKAAAAGA